MNLTINKAPKILPSVPGVKIPLVIALSGIMALSGCVSNNQTETAAVEERHYCTMPQSKQLVTAIEESRSTLSHAKCQSHYAEHFSALIDIAGGEPGAKNLEKLGLQSQWMMNKGIISKKDSEALLRRHFSPQLVSLDYDSDFNTYTHCSMDNQQGKIKQLLEQELEQKRRGLSGALGDHETYQMAVKEYQAVKLLLESTQNACQQAQRN